MNQESAAVNTTVSRHAQLPFVAVLAVACVCCTVRGEDPVVIALDISGVEHVEGPGSPNNTVIQVQLPAGAVIQGVGWAGTLTTVGESWASEADISISDGSASALFFTPAAGDFAPTPPGGTFYSTGGIMQFGGLGVPGYPVSGGVLYVEFSESFVDNQGSADAVWGSGATFSIEYEVVTVSECPADLNADGAVDVSDLLLLLGAWGPCPVGGFCPADFNADGAVDVSDLLQMLAAWGECPPGAELKSACCYGDGLCENLTQGNCNDSGGTYQGDFTKCETWSCAQPPDGTSCEQAIPVVIDGPANGGDTTGTAPPSWDLPTCQGAGIPPSNTGLLWFTVEGDGSWLTARTCESQIESRVGVYCAQGCLEDSFTCIAGSSFGDCDNPFNATVSWCSVPGRTYLIAVWSTTNSYGEVSLTVESGNACTDPLPCDLPCDGHCGSQSPAGCYCDDVLCNFFNDCCPGLCESCPEQPSCICQAECPPGATPEGEPCGADTNGGCNANPSHPPMTPITCGQTICGTLWADNGSRDTDWYRLDLSGHSQAVEVTFTVQADVDVIASIAEEGCPPALIAQELGCDVSMTLCLPPGVYSLVVVPTVVNGLPCSQGPFNYVAQVTCVTGVCPSQCVGWCGQQAPEGCWCDDECHLLEDCCPDVCVSCPGTEGC